MITYLETISRMNEKMKNFIFFFHRSKSFEIT
jgi:hypothetical protein